MESVRRSLYLLLEIFLFFVFVFSLNYSSAAQCTYSGCPADKSVFLGLPFSAEAMGVCAYQSLDKSTVAGCNSGSSGGGEKDQWHFTIPQGTGSIFCEYCDENGKFCDSIGTLSSTTQCSNKDGCTCPAPSPPSSCGDGNLDKGEECDLKDKNGVDGSGCDKDCKVDVKSVSLVMDEEYVNSTIYNRYFNPIAWGNTPFDDYDCRIEIPRYSSEKGISNSKGFSVVVEIPSESGWKVLGQYNAKYGGTVSKSGKLVDIYESSILGWPYGIDPSVEGMERVISAGKMRCKVVLPTRNITSNEINFKTCVKILGSDGSNFPVSKFDVVGLRTKRASLTAHQLLEYQYTVINDGFLSTSPFRERNMNFSYYIELRQIDDLQWPLSVSGFIHYKSPPKLEEFSSCPNGAYNLIYTGKPIYDAYAIVGKKLMFINLEYIRKRGLNLGLVVMHEFGHSFSGLWDEYFLVNGATPSAVIVSLIRMQKTGLKNCRLFDGDFLPWGESGKGNVNCTIGDWYAPSSHSLMKCDDKKYNLFSCGYLLNKIDGGDIKNSRGLCRDMDVIKPR